MKIAYKKSKILRIAITVILSILSLVFIVKIKSFIVSASEESNYQYVYDGKNNKIITLKVKQQNGSIYLFGLHAKSAATISYRTKGYNFTLENSSTNPKSKDNFYLERIESDDGEINPYVPDDTYVTDEYMLVGKDVIKGVVKLLRNKGMNQMDINKALGDTDGKGGVTVYMSNAFKVITRPDGSGSENEWMIEHGKLCHSLNEIINEVKNLFGVEWGSLTQELLPYYYDNPIKITLKPFAYKVVYLLEEDYNAGNTSEEFILTTAEDNLTAICGADSTYTIKDVNNIEINGTSYQYAGNSYYKYWGKDGFYDTVTNNGTISVEHQFQRDATMYILVKGGGDNEVKVRYVDEEGSILKDNINGGKITKGERYTYNNIESPTMINSKSYEYTNKWSYSYITSKDTVKNSGPKNGTPNFIISDIKKDTVVTVDLVMKEIEGASSELINVSYFIPNTTGEIKADDIGSEKFLVESGIPTTEDLYGTVQSSEYLINASFEKISKELLYPIKVTKTYILSWKMPIDNPPDEGDGNTEIRYETVTETVPVEAVVYVKRAYTYTEIKSLEYYKINDATLNNDSLPGSSLTLVPSSYSVPSLNYQHYEGEEGHLIQPKQVNTGIQLPTQTITSQDEMKPSIPDEMSLFQSTADTKVDQIKVRNDYMEFGSSIILSNVYTEKEAQAVDTKSIQLPRQIDKAVLYQGNLTIDSIKSNGSYSSSGTIRYSKVLSFQSNKNDILTFTINNINNVVIHTPVYCEGSLSNNNAQYVQLVHPNNAAIPIVLDEYGVANDFVVHISNTGFHTAKTGYHTRDYSINTKGTASYIARDNQGLLRNEVKFPFDVIIDVGNDKNSANDSYLKANTWYVIGLSKHRMYVPLYVEEGNYLIDFRTVAVNGMNRLSTTEVNANANRNNYIATHQLQVEISGRLYGLTLYDIYDYPMWQEVFRGNHTINLKFNGNEPDGTLRNSAYANNKQYYYTVGGNNLNGISSKRNIKFTFPLVSGSHPKFMNQGMLKAGYTWRFTFDTIGGEMMQDTSYVEINPTFYYIKKDGSNREEIDLYYQKTVEQNKLTLVKVRSNREKKDIKIARVGDIYLGIPKLELKTTATIREMEYNLWESLTGTMYNYSLIKSNYLFQTFTGTSYANELALSKAGKSILDSGVTKNAIIKRKQSYYLNYSLPANVRAVTKGYDVASYANKYGIRYTEDFWKRDGYIIVHFEITAYDSNGKAYMNYRNDLNSKLYGHCNMWKKEGVQETKVDYYGTKFYFTDGDVMIVPTDQTSLQDYNSGGIY